VGIPNHAKLRTKKKSFVILGLSMVSVIIVGEILINSIKLETEHFGLGQFFVGAIIIGIISNAPKHMQEKVKWKCQLELLLVLELK
jgi:Ca2+/H+ antiporter